MSNGSPERSPSPDQVHDLLRRYDVAQRAAQAAGHWSVTYFSVFAVAAVVLIPLGAFTNHPPVVVVVNLSWVALLVLMPIWSSRHRVTLRGTGRRMGLGFLIFALVYGLTCAVGFSRFPGQLWWWTLGGLASAAPLAIAAARQSRGTSRYLEHRLPCMGWTQPAPDERSEALGRLVLVRHRPHTAARRRRGASDQ